MFKIGNAIVRGPKTHEDTVNHIYWLDDFDLLKDFLFQNIRMTNKILILGCSYSELRRRQFL